MAKKEKEVKKDSVVKKVGTFFKDAFLDMAQNAKEQHEVDKANFEAVKAESKANFEENRFTHTYAKAKADAKKSWDDAHMSPKERQAKIREQQQVQIAEANARREAATAKYDELKAVRESKKKK